jgi:hypothetical protein
MLVVDFNVPSEISPISPIDVVMRFLTVVVFLDVSPIIMELKLDTSRLPPVISTSAPVSPQTPWPSPVLSYPQRGAESGVDILPPSIHPAASIEDLLRAYGVKPGPVMQTIPPPPAFAIFPPGYRTYGRVHTRSRPGSSRPFSRASSRAFPTQSAVPRYNSSLRVTSIAQSRRSDISSNILGFAAGRNTMGDFARGSASMLLGQSHLQRPETAVSSVPKLKNLEPMVEVVSCGTQTSPTSSVFTPSTLSTVNVGTERTSRRRLSETSLQQIITTAEEGIAAIAVPSVSRRRTRRKRKSGNIVGEGSKSSHLPVESYITNGKNCSMGGGRSRSQLLGIGTIMEEVAYLDTIPEYDTSRLTLSTSHNCGRMSEVPPEASITDIKNVSQAMEDYYRSKGMEFAPDLGISNPTSIAKRRSRTPKPFHLSSYPPSYPPELVERQYFPESANEHPRSLDNRSSTCHQPASWHSEPFTTYRPATLPSTKTYI